jgi:hypothetical protein
MRARRVIYGNAAYIYIELKRLPPQIERVSFELG